LEGFDASSWAGYSTGTGIVFFVLYSVDNPTEYKSIVLVIYLLIEPSSIPSEYQAGKVIPNSLISCGLSSLPVYGPANQTNMVSSRLIAGKHQVCDIRASQRQCDQ
jgi:hypothetical protein